MAYPVKFSKTADRQLVELQSYLTRRFYRTNVERYMERLVAECMSLGESPHRGSAREGVRPGIRVIGFERKAAIYFRLANEQVIILAIRYGGYQGRPSSLK